MAKDPVVILYSKNNNYPHKSTEPILRHKFNYDETTEEGEKFIATYLAKGYVKDPSLLVIEKPEGPDKDQKIAELEMKLAEFEKPIASVQSLNSKVYYADKDGNVQTLEPEPSKEEIEEVFLTPELVPDESGLYHCQEENCEATAKSLAGIKSHMRYKHDIT